MEDLSAAAEALRTGNLVAFPTETVYGLGGDATNESALNKIFQAKGRPRNHPLIVHLAAADMLRDWTNNVPTYAAELAIAFWPGPLTIILKAASTVGRLVTGGQDTVGIRVPSHPVALELLSLFAQSGGSGVAAPSANRFGKVSPTSAQAVRQELAQFLSPADLIIDGGDCQVGVESTIVDCTGSTPAIARPGAVTARMIQDVLGSEPSTFSNNMRVSGSLPGHYSPRAKVLLNTIAAPGDGLIAMSDVKTPHGVIRLLKSATSAEYARGLYRALRQADDIGLESVVAILPSGDDIAVAIRDRLSRASSDQTDFLSFSD